MKALILAAGNGTRLRPLTDNVPKCLLPIRGIPLLAIWLNLCASHGIREIFVNTHATAMAIDDFVSSYRGPASIRTFNEKSLLGSAGTLLALRNAFDREPFFWVIYGDVLTAIDLDKMLEFHLRSECLATLGLYEAADPRACGIVCLDQRGIVRDFSEKPAHPASNLAFAGVMVCSPEILIEIPSKPVCDIGFDLLPRLIGRMAGYKVNEYLVDIGTISAYQAAQREWPGLPAHPAPEYTALSESTC